MGRAERLRTWSRWMAALVALIAATVLVVGYGFRETRVTNLAPGLAAMKANTAVALLLASGALLLDLWDRPLGWKARAFRGAGVAVALIGALNLVEHATGADLGIDELISVHHGVSETPGRISIATSTALLFIGVGFALDFVKLRGSSLSAGLVRIPATIGFVALFGYAFDASKLYAVRPFDTIAFHTAFSLFILSVAFTWSRPSKAVSLAVSDGAGGHLVRRIIPAAIVVPAVLGYLTMRGFEAGFYPAGFGITLFATMSAGVLVVIVFWTARELQGMHDELLRREEKLAITLHSIGDGVIATDDAGRITRMNPVAEQLTGWPFDEARGRPLQEVFNIVNETTRRPVDNPVDRVLAEGVIVGLANHTSLISRSGEECPIADSGAPIRAAGGAILGAVLVFRDQSEERKAEESAMRFARLGESGLFGVAVARRDGFIEEANDEFLRIIGWSRQELEALAFTWKDLIPVDYAGRSKVGLSRLDTQGKMPSEETEYKRKGGALIPVMRGAAALDPTRSIVFVLDLSTQRKALDGQAQAELGRAMAEAALADKEDQLRQAQKMEAIGRLAGGVAHDFNNLLSVILSYSAIILEELDPKNPLAADVTEIERAGIRASELTKQLLAFGRKQVLKPQSLDLNQSIHGMTNMLRRVIGEDIELVLKCEPDLSRVLVDPSQIEQVFLNLSVNARDAMPSGGKITIETLGCTVQVADLPAPDIAPGGYVLIRFTDTGSGIDPSALPRIFEPFFTTKAIGKGTGLGLATSFGVVKQSGGHITVNTKLGEGTTFTVYLPCAPVEQTPTPRTPAPSIASRGEETILLVEDHEQLRQLTKRVLQRAGYRVIEASDGVAALEEAEAFKGNIDLLLTDIVMPKMSGRELVEKATAARPGLRTLYMSGYTDDTIIHHGVETSTVEVIHKPAAPQVLLARVRAVLDGAAL